MIPEKDRGAFGPGWRRYRYGPGVFKLDWALNAPIPWRDEGSRRAGTVHIGGSFEEIAASEHLANHGDHSDEPYIILTQPSIFDATRAPAGSHTAWAYCHVPHGSTVDMTLKMEARIEREAPGFGDCIIARHSMTASALEAYNANYVGGDINGGVQDIRQLFRRPVSVRNPYRTPLRGVYLCSSSTPPGGAVHGMCGYHAARAALEDLGTPAYNSENP
jgi:phytoene dehydrogenase-like protein